MTARAKDITVVSAEVPQERAGQIADWLAEHEIFASTWEDREGGPSRVEIYLPDAPDDPDWAPYGDSVSQTPAEAAAHIAAAGAAEGLDLRAEISTIKAEDWS